MINIVVVFPKREIAANIRNILVRSGFEVMGACTTGASAMHFSDSLDEGIIICGYRLPDMLYTELRDCLPESFEFLLIASEDKWADCEVKGVVGLSMPFKVYDLLNTVDMMQKTVRKRKKNRKEELKNRNKEQRVLVNKAKELLMDRNNMTEEEAHRYLQKCSMSNGINMIETAEMVLSVMKE